MQDSYRHRGLRSQLIARLRERGISDEVVLQAMLDVPRHFFLEKTFVEKAYDDVPFPIGREQTISQPYTVAFQTSLLAIKPREQVLEVGTGSGYQAAILARLGARVFTVERHGELYKRAKKLLRELRPGNVRVFHRDGYKGLPEFAPFQKILVTAGAPVVPPDLLDQLAIGGHLVIPIGEAGERQAMFRYTRHEDGSFTTEDFGAFRFVPMLPGTEE